MIVLVTGMDRQGRFTGPFHESADGQFQVCDPLSRKITLTEAELERYMDTPVGKAALAVFEQMPSKTGEMI